MTYKKKDLPPNSVHTQSNELVLPVYFFFDLMSLQNNQSLSRSKENLSKTLLNQQQYLYLSNTWIPKLLHHSNQLLKHTKIKLQFIGFEMWNSSNGRKGLALSDLHALLAKKSKQYTSSITKDSVLPLPLVWIGVTSFAAPSYPKIQDWIYSQYLSPHIVMRRFQYAEVRPSQRLKVQSQFLIRSIANLLGAVGGCEKDWASASRQELQEGVYNFARSIKKRQVNRLPLSTSPKPSKLSVVQDSKTAQDLKTAQDSKTAQDLKTAQDSSKIQDQSKIQVLSWSKRNIKLIQQHAQNLIKNPQTFNQIATDQACQIQVLLDNHCTLDYTRQAFYTRLCYQDPTRLIKAYQAKQLQAQRWKNERSIAQGILALHTKNNQKAFDLCAPIANQDPTSYAPKCAGKAALVLKRYPQAIKYFRAYLSTHSNDHDSLFQLAKALGYTQDHQGALANLLLILSQVTPINSHSTTSIQNLQSPLTLTQIWYNIGVAYAKLDNVNQAIKYWQKIPQNASEYSDAQKIIYYFTKQRSNSK